MYATLPINFNLQEAKLSGFGMTRDLSEEEYYTIQAGRKLCIKWTALKCSSTRSTAPAVMCGAMGC